MKLNSFYKRHRKLVKEADKQAEGLRKLQEKQECKRLKCEEKKNNTTTN